MVQVRRGTDLAGGTLVFVEPLEGQGVTPWGVRADAAGTSWFALPEPGRYRFACEGEAVQVETRCHPVQAPAGYDHLQKVEISLPAE